MGKNKRKHIRTKHIRTRHALIFNKKNILGHPRGAPKRTGSRPSKRPALKIDGGRRDEAAGWGTAARRNSEHADEREGGGVSNGGKRARVKRMSGAVWLMLQTNDRADSCSNGCRSNKKQQYSETTIHYFTQTDDHKTQAYF